MTGTRVIDGAALAQRVGRDLVSRAAAFRARAGRPARLAGALLPGDDAAAAFLHLKGRAFEAVGLEATACPSVSASTAGLVATIEALNADPDTDGILLQYPLPPEIDTAACFGRIAPEKDVDASGPRSLGAVLAGHPGFIPATPAAILRLLSAAAVDLRNAEVLVVAGEDLIARPLALLLLDAGARVVVRGPDARDVGDRVAKADVIVGASGIPAGVRITNARAGAVVVDAGYYHPGGAGDLVIEEAVLERLAAWVPPRGGVGPMTVTLLMENTLRAAEMRA